MRSLKAKNLEKRKVDVLLINPSHPRSVYQGLADEFSAIEPPSLAALFASYLRLKGVEVELIDGPGLGLSPEQIAEVTAQNFVPRLVALVVYGFQPSASTQNMPAARATAVALKKCLAHVPVILTGTHPAALPENTLLEEPVDFVCDGEGPQTLWKLVEQLRAPKPDFRAVPNLWFREQDTIIAGTRGELVTNLAAEMPGAAWDLLPMERYRAHNWHCFEDLSTRTPYASIHTSLGCPFRCSFCCINAPFGQPSYRMWPAACVIQEIDTLVRVYGVRNIKIADEMFVLNREHVMSICEQLIARKYNLNIWAYARVDTISDDLLPYLKSAGFRWLAIGIESASRHVRQGMAKGKFSTDHILEVVRSVQQAGIRVIGNYIFGLPDDTRESLRDTLDLAIEANCEFANFYSAMAYPGSALHRTAKEKSWPLPDTWLGYSQHSSDSFPLPTATLTSAEVLEFRDQAFHEYFSHPRYLAMVRSRFGSSVVQHLSKMCAIPLKRRLHSWRPAAANSRAF